MFPSAPPPPHPPLIPSVYYEEIETLEDYRFVFYICLIVLAAVFVCVVYDSFRMCGVDPIGGLFGRTKPLTVKNQT